MTMQDYEAIFMDGEVCDMDSYPLCDYFEQSGWRPAFQDTDTGLHRGYRGTWQIRDQRLYLVRLNATLQGWKKIGIEDLFPYRADAVFAFWYSGEIVIPVGKSIHTDLMSHAMHARDVILTIEKGVQINAQVRHNIHTPPEDVVQMDERSSRNAEPKEAAATGLTDRSFETYAEAADYAKEQAQRSGSTVQVAKLNEVWTAFEVQTVKSGGLSSNSEKQAAMPWGHLGWLERSLANEKLVREERQTERALNKAYVDVFRIKETPERCNACDRPISLCRCSQ